MSGAKKDDNGYPTIYGMSCVDGIIPVRIQFTATGIKLDMTTVISVVPSPTSFVDNNDYPIAKGVSSSDASIVLPWYVNPTTGAVLAST